MSEELNKLSEIKDVPNINDYPDIINASREGRLIIFVGAGVSKLINVPLWREFAKYRLDTIYKKNIIDYRTYTELLKQDPKKLLTICNIIMKENNIKYNSAKEVFKFNDNEDYYNVYSKLYKINAIYITTNYDECLDIIANKKDNIGSSKIEVGNIDDIKTKKTNLHNEVIINRSDILESKLSNGNVIHLHGSIKKEEEMLVTINDYLEFYGNTSIKVNPFLNTFLNRVFNSKYLVLFIGYGLDEYEILEYILNKGNNPQIGKHYMLYPAYKEECNLVYYLGKYYNNLGVKLIPYNISKKGYEQLKIVIDEWSNVLCEVSKEPDFIQKTLLINDKINDENNYLKDYLEVSVNTVLDLIKDDDKLETYFFDNVYDKTWLPELIKRGFYKPENIPTNIRNGYVYWNKVDFIAKVVKELKSEDEEDICSIINIIKEVSLYVDDNKRHIDNYHIWNKFIEIISHIPSSYVDLEIIKLIKIWLDSEYEVEYTSYRVAKELLIKYLNSEDKTDFEKVELIVSYLMDYDKNRKIKINNFYIKVFNYENISKIANKSTVNLFYDIKTKLRKLIQRTKSHNIIKCEDKQFLLELEVKDKFFITMTEVGEMNFENVDQPYEKLSDDKVTTFDFLDKTNIVKLISGFVLENAESEKLEKSYEKKILNLYYSLYTEGTYRSLYDFNIGYSPYGYELILDLLLKLINNYNNNLSDFLKGLLDDEYFLFQKVLLYVIGKDMAKYESIFWNIIDQEKGGFIFENAAFGDELRVILEQIKSVNEVQQNKLLMLINKGPGEKSEEYENQEYIDIWKQKRLNSLKHIPVFEELYKEIKTKTNINPKLGPIIGRLETKSSSNKSPLTLEDLLNMNNNEIAKYLESFKTKDFWDGPTSEGLKDEITNLSKKYPNKIISDMEPFLNTNSFYIYGILNGIKDAWKSNQTFDWNKIFSFIICYINRESFWNDEFQYNDGHWKATFRWVIQAVSELISAGSENMSLSFEFSNYKKAKEILLLILYHIEDLYEENNSNDYVTYVINSAIGISLETLVDISLYKKNTDKDVWDIDLKKIYEKCLIDGVMDSYIIFGLYLSSFYFLDNNWTSKTIKMIKNDNANWEPFICGYLNNNTIYFDLYLLMKEHYSNAINYKFKDSNIKDNLAEHIGVGVTGGIEEELDYQLINQIMEKWDYQMIEKLIWYFSSINSEEDDKQTNVVSNGIEYIISFWDTIYQKYKNYKKDEINEKDKEIISRSVKLVKVLDEINDKNCYLLKFSLPYAGQYESYVVIEELHKKINSEDDISKRKIIGELILIISENCITDYEKDKLKEIVEYLYKSNDQDVKDIANEICNNYQMKHLDFLRNTYLHYNN